LPVSLTPGIQFKAKFFHYGTFRGSLSVGIKAHPKYHPKLQFDSFTGLRVDLHTKLKETTITPPNWMVSTSHFECGIALEPTIWIKGHMGNAVRNSKFAAALRPYFNMTITRAGHVTTPGDLEKELVIYPFRVVGLPVDSNKRYKVRIETSMPSDHCRSYHSGDTGKYGMEHYRAAGHNQYQNGEFSRFQNEPVTAYSAGGSSEHYKPYCEHFKRRMDSTEGLNWGELEFHDPVDRFSFGVISQRMLMHLHTHVQLIEVDYSSGAPVERASERKKLKCHTIISGVCQPSPMMHEIWWTDGSHVKIYAHMIWKENPRPWFVERIRGVAVDFPEVIVNKDYIQQVIPGFKISSYFNLGKISGTNVDKPLVLVLKHAYKSYPVMINKHNGYVPV
jgi:hypothetical protein